MTPDDALPPLAVLNWLRAQDAGRLQRALDATDFRVLRLDGSRVRDEASLLAACEALLGRDFAAGGWDALRDVLPELVGRSPSGRSCLVWHHVDAMFDGGLPDLVTALLLLVETARDLANRDQQFVSFLIGEGPNFRPL